MNRYLKAVLVWVVWPALAVGVTTVATAAATAAAAATLPPDMAGQIDSLVEATLQRKHAPGAVVAIVSDGAVVLRKAYGQADLDPQRPMRIDSRFEIGSITKQLTAAAILRLCASGKLSLDDTLRHHVLGYAAGGAITIRQLLQQTSGIPDFAGTPAFAANGTRQPATFDAILATVRDMPLEFAPGQRWKYSNTNYVILSRIVELAGGMPFDRYLAQQVMAPAGMRRSATLDAIGADAGMAELAVGYTTDANRAVPAERFQASWLLGAGNLVSSADDLLAWNRALFGGQVLAPDWLARMTTPATLNDGTRTAYAAGVFVDHQGGHARIWHGGGTLGFSSASMHYPTDRLDIVVLVNHEDVNASALGAAIFELLVPSAAASLVPAPGEDPAISAKARAWLQGLKNGTPERASLTQALNARLDGGALAPLRARLDIYGRPEAFVFAGKLPARDGVTERLVYRLRFGAQWLSFTMGLSADGRLDSVVVTPD